MMNMVNMMKMNMMKQTLSFFGALLVSFSSLFFSHSVFGAAITCTLASGNKSVDATLDLEVEPDEYAVSTNVYDLSFNFFSECEDEKCYVGVTIDSQTLQDEFTSTGFEFEYTKTPQKIFDYSIEGAPDQRAYNLACIYQPTLKSVLPSVFSANPSECRVDPKENLTLRYEPSGEFMDVGYRDELSYRQMVLAGNCQEKDLQLDPSQKKLICGDRIIAHITSPFENGYKMGFGNYVFASLSMASDIDFQIHGSCADIVYLDIR